MEGDGDDDVGGEDDWYIWDGRRCRS